MNASRSVARLNRRRGTRFRVNIDNEIAVYAGSQRIEGRVIDESVTGLGTLFPRDCGLKERQKVRFIFRRARRAATVTFVRITDDGDSVGLVLDG